MDKVKEPTLCFTCDFDELTAWEVEQKGWFQCAALRMPSGIEIPLSFWDPVRLSQDLKSGVNGSAVITFSGTGCAGARNYTLNVSTSATLTLADGDTYTVPITNSLTKPP